MTAPALPQRYVVLGLLGEGGSGRVYRVRDSTQARDLALKLVTPAESSFLRREFNALRQIRHENLIQVFDWGSLESGEAYYTMELIEGADWGAQLGRPQPPGEVQRILEGLLRGLAHLHCHGEIHGDLKPGNALLGQGGIVKLADVGMGGSQGIAAGVSGTPGYAAPETWEGAPADVRSDLYSVGVMAYEALTGRHPFYGRTIREVVSGQLEGWVPSPSAHGARVPVDLERAVMRALERDHGLRQASADEFMEGIGVEDRVGVILGGRFVDRRREIERILEIAMGAAPSGPTAVRILGPQGSGRSALISELGWELAGAGFKVHEVPSRGERHSLAELATSLGVRVGVSPGDDATIASRLVAKIAEALWERATNTPQAILYDAPPGSDGSGDDEVLPVARYLWALSMERARPTRVLLVLPGELLGRDPEQSEAVVELGAFDRDGVRDLTTALLGTVRIEDAFLEKLHSLTGGMPGPVRAAVMEFREREILVRRQGIWFFQEVEQIKDLELKSSGAIWDVRLRHMPGEDRDFLLAMSLLGPEVREEFLQAVEAAIPGSRQRASLRARGWLAREGDGSWRLQSEGLREALRAKAEPAKFGSIAGLLLERASHLLSREEKADLTLTANDHSTLGEVLWAGKEAMGRGDLRLAQRRLEGCLASARAASNFEIADEATVQLAECLQKLGQTQETIDLLSEPTDSIAAGGDTRLRARRELLLGSSLRVAGEPGAARDHFQRAIDLADRSGDEQLALRTRAGLAELSWSQGGARGVAEAIPIIRGLLRREWGDPTLLDERAALSYGLGAALIWSGQRGEATDILETAFNSGCSDYWRMRIANALGVAYNAIGHPDNSLVWFDSAWEFAEKSGADSFKARILCNRAGTLCGLGRFSDALQQDQLSSMWGRRTGSAPEYLSGLTGAAINQIYLGDYESAIAGSEEAREAASRTGNPTDLAKALEMKALALFFAGAYDEARAVVESALDRTSDGDYLQVKPRLKWLQARLALVEGDEAGALRLLRDALEQLREGGDPEDLLGVEIELLAVRARSGESDPILHRIHGLLLDGQRRGIRVVYGQAALAIAEIVVRSGIDEEPYRKDLLSALEWAEQASMVEVSWALAYRLGQLAACAGDARAAHARFTHAQRVLRRLADSLGPVHRRLFLNRPDIREAIAEMTRGL